MENVINHLTSGATIDIDDRQVMQLHCAMVGAFGAVINFLKRVSLDTDVQVELTNHIGNLYTKEFNK
jgi:hypothetical protein